MSGKLTVLIFTSAIYRKGIYNMRDYKSELYPRDIIDGIIPRNLSYRYLRYKLMKSVSI